MPILFALAVSIGLIAVPVIWSFLGPLAPFNLQIWQCFIAWGCFYHCGGGITGIKTTVVGMTFGAFIGAIVVIAAGYLGVLGVLAVPIAGAVGASVIVLAAHVGLLSTIPASVYGFAAIAALILLKGLAPLDAILPTVSGIVLGAAIGWVSEFAGKRLASTT